MNLFLLFHQDPDIAKLKRSLQEKVEVITDKFVVSCCAFCKLRRDYAIGGVMQTTIQFASLRFLYMKWVNKRHILFELKHANCLEYVESYQGSNQHKN